MCRSWQLLHRFVLTVDFLELTNSKKIKKVVIMVIIAWLSLVNLGAVIKKDPDFLRAPPQLSRNINCKKVNGTLEVTPVTVSDYGNMRVSLLNPSQASGKIYFSYFFCLWNLLTMRKKIFLRMLHIRKS